MNKANVNPFGPLGWTPERLGDLSGRTYVITGANSGTGFEATRIFLAKGARVVMLNRNAEKTAIAIAKLKREFSDKAKVSFVKLDLASLDSVRAAAANLLEQIEHIDALICNAAIAQVPRQTITVDGFESHLGVNHYGHFLLCGLIFSTLEKSNGRIVIVASQGYKMGLRTIQFSDMNWNENYHQNNTYCHSKLAQMMFGYELQDRLKTTDKQVKVYVCHPGASKTSLIETSGNLATRLMFRLMSLSPMVQSAKRGSYPQVMCATENDIEERALYGPTGCSEWVGPVGKGTLEEFAYEKDVMSELWSLSEKQTGLLWNL